MKLMWRVRSIGAIAFRGMLVTLLNRKALVISVVTGIILLVIAFRLSVVPPPGGGEETPLALWDRGAEGAVAAFAFAFVPLVVPVIAIALSYDARRVQQSSGFLETAMSRRSPHWAVALGRFLGLFVAIALPVLVITASGIGIIASRSAVPPSSTFIAAILLGALLLAALYVATVLVLTTIVTPGAAAWLMTGLWFAFNLVRQTPFVISGQLLLILQVREVQQFRTGFADLASFSGMYEGFLAHFTPASLNFVVRPTIEDLTATLAHSTVAAAGPVVLLGLVIVYLAMASRYPLGR